MKESNIQKKIMLSIQKYSRVFRNNTGTGWVGQKKHVKGGGILLENPRPLRAGLTIGSSDLIGWTTKIITPDMVGKKIAVFTAIEVKTAKGISSEYQLNFIKRVKESGGIAGIVENEEEALSLVQ